MSRQQGPSPVEEARRRLIAEARMAPITQLSDDPGNALIALGFVGLTISFLFSAVVANLAPSFQGTPLLLLAGPLVVMFFPYRSSREYLVRLRNGSPEFIARMYIDNFQRHQDPALWDAMQAELKKSN